MLTEELVEKTGIHATDQYGLRLMPANKETDCKYCGSKIQPGMPIGGHWGVLWGHYGCVREAYRSDTLILSPNNGHKRFERWVGACNRVYKKTGVVRLHPEAVPHFVSKQKEEQLKLDLHAEIGRRNAEIAQRQQRDLDPFGEPKKGTLQERYEEGRVPTKEVSEAIREGRVSIPDRSAKRFRVPPMKDYTKRTHFCRTHYVASALFPEEKRVSRHVESELEGTGQVRDFHDKAWAEELERKYDEWYRRQYALPLCPIHGPMKKMHTHANANGEKSVWLVCDGEV